MLSVINIVLWIFHSHSQQEPESYPTDSRECQSLSDFHRVHCPSNSNRVSESLASYVPTRSVSLFSLPESLSLGVLPPKDLNKFCQSHRIPWQCQESIRPLQGKAESLKLSHSLSWFLPLMLSLLEFLLRDCEESHRLPQVLSPFMSQVTQTICVMCASLFICPELSMSCTSMSVQTMCVMLVHLFHMSLTMSCVSVPNMSYIANLC